MPTYVNPSTMMGAHLAPGSALNGALAGVQGAYATKMGDQQIRAEDLSFMENMHKYQQDVLDDPVKEAERPTKIATSKYNLDQITSGRALDEFNTTLQGKKLGNEGKGLENEDKSVQLKGEFLNEIAQVVDNFNQRDPATAAAWNQYVERGAKIGVTLPSWPSDDTKSLIKARAAAFVNSPKHQNAIAVVKETGKETRLTHSDPNSTSSVQGFIDAHAPQLASQERQATTRANATVDAAEARAAQTRTIVEWAIQQAKKGNVELAVTEIMKTEVLSDPMLKVDAKRNAQRRAEIRQGLMDAAKEAAPEAKPTSSNKSEFTPAQEAMITESMKKNPKATRQQIIDGAKAEGLL